MQECFKQFAFFMQSFEAFWHFVCMCLCFCLCVCVCVLFQESYAKPDSQSADIVAAKIDSILLEPAEEPKAAEPETAEAKKPAEPEAVEAATVAAEPTTAEAQQPAEPETVEAATVAAEPETAEAPQAAEPAAAQPQATRQVVFTDIRYEAIHWQMNRMFSQLEQIRDRVADGTRASHFTELRQEQQLQRKQRQ